MKKYTGQMLFRATLQRRSTTIMSLVKYINEAYQKMLGEK